jgi:hypothetical protein
MQQVASRYRRGHKGKIDIWFPRFATCALIMAFSFELYRCNVDVFCRKEQKKLSVATRAFWMTYFERL